MEEEGSKILFLHNQARCGGTLVTVLFRETSRCVCINEPTYISTISNNIFFKYTWNGATARRLFRNTICMMRKPYSALRETVDVYHLKRIFLDILIIEMVKEIFPEAIQFFIYRDPIEIAKSMRRI
ncbi:hypothetical protein LSH36_1738g00023 [Paralvinella palmiformis]|uniref:Sulfotransferase n=1 Tax=Paralvinella palmiformis TaxID=53620 RepID=A0AAD9IT24_9ANNE|nr:hypothetical protein LSH36_1738g00023 [Paralvinella palmiformis]